MLFPYVSTCFHMPHSSSSPRICPRLPVLVQDYLFSQEGNTRSFNAGRPAGLGLASALGHARKHAPQSKHESEIGGILILLDSRVTIDVKHEVFNHACQFHDIRLLINLGRVFARPRATAVARRPDPQKRDRRKSRRRVTLEPDR